MMVDSIAMGVIFGSMALFFVFFFCFLIRYRFACPSCGNEFRMSLLRYAVKSKILWSGKRWSREWDGGVTAVCPACGEENRILPH